MAKTKLFALILGVLIMSFLIGYLVLAWTDAPAGTPPTCPAGYPGCDAPINVGSTYQQKAGGLGAATFYDYNNNSWWVDPAGGAGGYAALFNGNVGIGTASPGAKLDVNGQIKIQGGSPGAGKILTSDASGLASWQAASGGTLTGSGTANYISKWTGGTSLGNSVIYDNGTNVGIGTAGPGEKLEVNGNFKVTGNSNTCHLVHFDDIAPAETCPAGYYTWDAVAKSPTGYMMCCKVDNPI